MSNTANNKLNYIQLVNKFWNVNMEYNFTGNEAKLYFYLLHVSNSLGWKNPFRNSLRQILNGTGISTNSIKTAQKRLAESGLISIKVGSAGNRFDYKNKTEYRIGVSIFDTATDTAPDTGKTTAEATAPDTIKKLNETKQIFEDFRKLYPGDKRGLETEFKNFLKKNKPGIANLLLPALHKEIEHRNKAQLKNMFVPGWKHLSTWINKKCWEQEFQPINGYTQANDSFEPIDTMER